MLLVVADGARQWLFFRSRAAALGAAATGA
jgi:hypothetical protein